MNKKTMPVCAACEQLRLQPSDVAPHPGLMPPVGAARMPFVTHDGISRTHARYLCRVCRSTMVRTALDDNSDPIWDLYAG